VAVAATYREGTFAYRVPLADGKYDVTLTFVEPSQSAGNRIFDVLANGRPFARKIDIAAQTGIAKAMRRSGTVTVARGVLELSFKPTKGQAIVSAIEINRSQAQR
jgi:beta-galactosidase